MRCSLSPLLCFAFISCLLQWPLRGPRTSDYSLLPLKLNFLKPKKKIENWDPKSGIIWDRSNGPSCCPHLISHHWLTWPALERVWWMMPNGWQLHNILSSYFISIEQGRFEIEESFWLRSFRLRTTTAGSKIYCRLCTYVVCGGFGHIDLNISEHEICFQYNCIIDSFWWFIFWQPCLHCIDHGAYSVKTKPNLIAL